MGMFDGVLGRKKYRDKVVGEHTYSIKLLSPYTSVQVAQKIMDVALPVATMMIDQGKAQDTWGEDGTPLTSLALLLCQQLKEADVLALIKLLLDGCEKDGVAIDPEEEFAGEVYDFYALLGFALKENFSDFFIRWLKEMGLEIPTLETFLKPAAPVKPE